MIRFANPWFLALTLLVAGVVWVRWLLREARPTTAFPHLELIREIKPTWRVRLRWLPQAARVGGLLLAAIALARPQSASTSNEITSQGIDIMLVLDVSGSMKAEDFRPNNRLYVAKQVIHEFIEGRTNDRIGLIVFAGQSFTQCPLTLDYRVLTGFLDKIDFEMVEDGTAIGMAIANAVNRLRESTSKSKIIILLTDGVNNRGQIEPLTAAEIARTMGVKIYSIGVGKPGNAMYPVDDPVFGKRYVYLPNDLDEESLKRIADRTNGRYYRAQSEAMLEQIYREIGMLEKTEVKIREYVQYRELIHIPGVGALLLLGFAGIAGATLFRTLP